jgi:TRAP-type C4-dicarboxylate transport system permease small subunit
MKQRISRHTARIILFVNRVEDWFLILMLSTMVTVAVAQIVYRNLFDSGIVWADPLLRVLVLWVALSGAVIATRTNNHIRIDFFSRYLTRFAIPCLQRVVYAFCIFICALIAWHGARFVSMDYEVGTIAFSGVPSWTTELIIPIAFFLMAVRYLMLFIVPPEVSRR